MPEETSTPKVDRQGVGARLATALTHAIVEGRLVPGQRLVEVDLQTQYNVGRSSVREALQLLAAQGLVKFAANRGATVRRLSRTEVEDMFAIRERLEGLAAFQAARRVHAGTAKTHQIRGVQELIKQMDTVVGGSDAMLYGRLNRDLHNAILELSGNVELVHFVNQLSLPIFQQQFHGFLRPDKQRMSHAQHHDIASAILSGNSRLAELAMRRHVRAGLAQVHQWPDENFEPTPLN